MPKKSIRASMLEQRRQLATAVYAELSRKVQDRLLETPEFAAAEILALYSPVANEVATDELFHRARRQGKRVAYPRVRGELLEFVEVGQLAELTPGFRGILEPSGSMLVPLAGLDLLLVPGVVFDQRGHRLGYGKGFYDRTLHLSGRCAKLIGLSFEFQLVTELPVEFHDIGMDMLVTETRALQFFVSSN
ncbi:MAG: 5-formyltetrahydrofolate cyclo-ligase, partial [Desulfuromonadaceae bacterium]